MAKTLQKNCVVCGKIFEAKQAARKYCSRECIKEANRNGIGWNTILKRECVICGKKFETNKPRKITCGEECKQKVKTANERELRQRKMGKKERTRNTALAEENRKAKELGLTYGQYQAYKYAKGE